MSDIYLPPGLPIPVPEPSGLSKPFWDGLRNETIMVQRNSRTGVINSRRNGSATTPRPSMWNGLRRSRRA